MNDWLSEIEENVYDSDVERMARVLRELAGYLKGVHLPEASDDAKELLKRNSTTALHGVPIRSPARYAGGHHTAFGAIANTRS